MELYCPCSENKAADQLRSYCEADLHLFSHMQIVGFLMMQLIFIRCPLNGNLIMSRIMRKPDFCLCENKGADQLRSNCEADQRLCFRYLDSTIPLLSKSGISSL